MDKRFIALGVWYIAIAVWLIWLTASREGMSIDGSLFMGIAVLCGVIAGLSLHDWIKESVCKLKSHLQKKSSPASF